MNLWGGRERSRRQREQLLHSRIKLCRGGEHSIVAAARLRCNPVCDLALHHDHHALKVFRELKQPQQNVGSNVVRKIADNSDRLKRELNTGTSETRLRSEQGIE